MLDPVSAIGLPFGIAAIYALARPGNAVSAEAKILQDEARAIVERVEDSDALFGSKVAVIAALHALPRFHDADGWDGGEAKPVDSGAIARAIAFVRALPEGCEIPEVSVEPDGAVALDWMPSRHRMLSISVSGANDRLAYAWIDGTDRGSAVSRFGGSTIPPRLLQAIEAVSTVPAHAVLRAA
jgi:hypothetical protein